MKSMINKFKWPYFFTLILLLSVQDSFAQYAKTVAKDGSGDYLTVQAAIDAAPTGQTTPYRIFIKNGTYKEVVSVPSNKPFIQLIGESVAKTIITFDNFSGKPMPVGGTFGTSNSATVTISATDFSAQNITFENTTGESPQAVAINVNNDRASFKNCRFLGGQDTLLANNNGLRQYYLNCYIDGTVDFIFGNARAVFDYCIIYPKDRSTAGGSFITAANTKSPEIYGYVFRNCEITANTGNTLYVLGRPWQNDANTPDASKSRNQTVFINTKMSSSINPVGWAVWDSGTNTSFINYAEFNSLNPDGSPLNVSSRVSWSKQLTSAEAAVYSDANLFAGWNPTAMFLDGAAYTSPLVVSNFAGKKGLSTTPFKWNISWPITGVQYDVYRSTNNGVDFSIVNTQTSSTANVNFSYSAPNPPPGESYQYYVKASKATFADHNSDIITISSVPTITVQGSLGSFLQGLGTPSNTQTYTVSGVDLTQDIVITPPAGYEISSNGGTNWFDINNPIRLSPTSGTVANTVITVRLNTSTAATYSGNITHSSTGATIVNLAVTGTTQTAPLQVSSTLISWPLTANNVASGVATGVNNATVPTLNNFTLSNGVFTATVPAYSVAHGMSFGVNANGGGWSSSATPAGPGSNLNRNFYTEFTVQPSANHQLRIDSIIFNTSLILTTGSFAISYSTNNFSTFTDITSGIAPDGSSAIFSTNGTFTNAAIAMIREDNTNNSKFKFPVSNLNVAVGANLKIRIYYRTGSGSDGRYVKIKDFVVKGEATSTLPLDLISFHASLEQGNSPSVNLVWETTNEVNTSKFEVERSIDGKTFSNIGLVAARNTAGIHHYNFTDFKPLNGTTYYRLKQLDINGQFEYSPIKAVDITNNQIIIYPNPINLELVINHLGAKANGKLSIFNSLGKEVLKVDDLKSENQTKVNVSELNSGIYFIQIKIGKEIFTSKFIKQ
jgi:pectinesterase